MISSKPSELKNILPLLLIVFIDALGMGIIFPILTPIFMDLGGILNPATSITLRNLLYGITMCVFPLGMFFGTPILGDLSDFIGRKRILLICLFGVAISYFLSSIAIIVSSVSLLIVSRIIAGLFAGSMSTAQAAVIDISSPTQKTKNLSLMLLPTAIGFVAGPLIAGITGDKHLISWFSWWTPLVIAALMASFNIGYLWFTFKETLPIRTGFIFKWDHGLRIFTDAFFNSSIRLLSIIYLFLQFGWSIYFQYISFFLIRRYHYSTLYIGLFMAIIGLGFAISLLYLVGIMTKYFKAKKIIIGALLISTTCILVTTLNIPPSLVWLLGFLLALAMSVSYPVIITLYSNTMGEDKQGWIMGVANAVVGFAWAITAFLGSFMERINDSFALHIGGIFMGLAALLAIFYPKAKD